MKVKALVTFLTLTLISYSTHALPKSPRLEAVLPPVAQAPAPTCRVFLKDHAKLLSFEEALAMLGSMTNRELNRSDQLNQEIEDPRSLSKLIEKLTKSFKSWLGVRSRFYNNLDEVYDRSKFRTDEEHHRVSMNTAQALRSLLGNSSSQTPDARGAGVWKFSHFKKDLGALTKYDGPITEFRFYKFLERDGDNLPVLTFEVRSPTTDKLETFKLTYSPDRVAYVAWSDHSNADLQSSPTLLKSDLPLGDPSESSRLIEFAFSVDPKSEAIFPDRAVLRVTDFHHDISKKTPWSMYLIELEHQP